MRVILIGGTSHTGKTTLANALAERLGWRVLSTDYVARHPGRPWRTDGSQVPPHAIDHFTSLTVDELMTDVLRHYHQVWGSTLAEIKQGSGLVVEGSAVLPSLAATILSNDVKGYWLTLNAEQIRDRIAHESTAAHSVDEQAAIKFADRAVAFDRYVTDGARKLGLLTLDGNLTHTELAARILNV